MKQPAPMGVAAATLLLAGALLGTVLAPKPAPAQILSGFDVYRSNCGGCHELYDPEDPKRTRQQWDDVLKRMVKVRGATLTPQEYTAVLNYLDSFNRPKREIQWVESPAKSRKAALDPKLTGKLPAEWVDLTVGADAQVPWAIQADAAGKEAYLSPLKAAGENQLPLLIDNTGIVKDGAATVRTQIVSGKGSVGAGVVFGFRNPQSFYGVRIGPRDVVLYQVQGGERALLARGVMATPMKKWQVLGVDVSGKSVTVSVNGKPVPGMTKSLDAYQGGRMGIHTQGDTVALFDQWQITVK